MKAHAFTRPALVAAIACAALSACDASQQNAGNGATVGQKVDRALAQTKEELSRAGEQVKPALEKAGEKMKEAADSDAAITASIKADYLKDPDLSVFKIDVDTKANVVTLHGTVETVAAHEAALRIAKGTDGVKQVVDNLTVR